jgi:hypothetical protein
VRQEPERHAGLRTLASDLAVTRKLVLVVIDGLTPTMLEASLGTAGADADRARRARHPRPRDHDVPR